MDESTEELCSQLTASSDSRHRRDFFERHPELVERGVVEQLAETVRVAVRVNVPRALRLAEAAVTIAAELDDDESLGRGLRAKANAMWFMGNCKDAVELFRAAERRFEQAGKPGEVARTLSSSIQSLLLIGDYAGAFQAAERAREIFQSLGESWRVARLEINVANIHHRQNNFAQALEAYQNAYRQLLPHKDMEGLGVALHNIAVCLIALDDFPHALGTYRELRAVCEQNGMPLLAAQADYNIAYLYYLRGEYSSAIRLLQATRESCRKNDDHYHLALCDLDQSEIYLELRLVSESAEMAESSFKQFDQLQMPFEAARSLVNLAAASSLEGDTARALELFERAREMMSKEKNQVWPFLINLYRAVVLLDAGQLEKARELSSSALAFFEGAGLRSKHVLSLVLSAKISLAEGEPEEVVETCDDALRLLHTFDSPILSYQAHLLQGEAYERLAWRDRAYSSYQAARLALENLRSSIQKDEMKIGFMRQRVHVYSHLVRLCLASRRRAGADQERLAEEALSYIEAAQSRALRELVFGSIQSGSQEPETAGSDEQVRELRRQLNWYYHRIEREQLSQDGSSGAQLESLQREAAAREHQLLALLREAPESGSFGCALRISSPATLAEVRAALGRSTALIEYFAIDGRIHAAVITAAFIEYVPLIDAEAAAQHLRMLDFQFSKFKLGREYVERFAGPLLRTANGHLENLFRDLFAPLKHLIEGRPQLVIVPCDPLHSLPFHALFDGERYLADTATLSYAPSASIYVQLGANRGKLSAGPALVIGVSDERTPHIRAEVEAVAAALSGAEVLTGSAATEETLRDRGRRARLVHIASHGRFRPDSPMFSGIRLADSYVTLFDFYHMRLPVDLLTLSGCVTGLNVIEEGDEQVGLARGLFYAGARSLLLSLWEVDDESTASFMQTFYSRLTAGAQKAAALREAMLTVRNSRPHPYYWAPFKLMGRLSAEEER